MFFRVLLIVMLIIGGVYVYSTRKPAQKVELPPKPPILELDHPVPAPVLGPAEIRRVHDAAMDTDSNVRWAAIELMYRVHDPEVIPILEKTLAMDTDVSMRKRALNLIQQAAEKQTGRKSAAVKDLLVALNDTEKDVRIMALLALGQTGDIRVIPRVTELLNDTDPQVRLQALHTLTQLQDQRNVAFLRLNEKLKQDYEQAVRRAEERAKEAR